MRQREQDSPIDWQAISEVTGLTSEELAQIQRRWERGEQPWEEVVEGVQQERDRRERSAAQALFDLDE